MKEFLKGALAILGYILIIPAISLFFYGLLGGADWLFRDPFNWIQDNNYKQTQTTIWDNCVYDTKKIFDQFNDTIGATYALEDLPSQGAREFMEYCLEISPNNIINKVKE